MSLPGVCRLVMSSFTPLTAPPAATGVDVVAGMLPGVSVVTPAAASIAAAIAAPAPIPAAILPPPMSPTADASRVYAGSLPSSHRTTVSKNVPLSIKHSTDDALKTPPGSLSAVHRKA